ncbi:MAG: ATP-binding protein [Jatrophihabitantaceae bacterium]
MQDRADFDPGQPARRPRVGGRGRGAPLLGRGRVPFLSGRGECAVCWNEVRLLNCDVRASAEARRFSARVIASQLGDEPWVSSLVADAELVTSELVNNSVAAGCSDLRLYVTVHRSRVRVAVYDNAGGLPHTERSGPDDVSGRGLMIIDALTEEWGVDATKEGKQVWADLGVRSEPGWDSALTRCHEAEPA